MSTLETQLTALCEAHALTSLSVNVFSRPDGEPYLYAYAHSESACGSAAIEDSTTFAEAIKLAIFNLNAKRYAVEVADLPAMEGVAA